MCTVNVVRLYRIHAVNINNYKILLQEICKLFLLLNMAFYNGNKVSHLESEVFANGPAKIPKLEFNPIEIETVVLM